MPNWSYTDVTITGPDAEIERFKQAYMPDDNGIDFDRIIPMPKIYWPECSTGVDEALAVLGRTELQKLQRHGTTVADLIKLAWEWPPSSHLGWVQKLQIRDAETFRAEYNKRYPHYIAEAQAAISAHAETGYANSLDWATANWGTKWHPRESEYCIDEQGRHKLYLATAWSPPLPVLEKIVATFPALSLDIYTRCEMGNYFVQGTISASGTDLRDDEAAMAEWEKMMSSEPPEVSPASH
jgi:hypothetical protein